jgi:RNA-directed DNA polymerase
MRAVRRRTAYAPSGSKRHWLPAGLSWALVERRVRRLQMRIAKAASQGRYRLARSLQWVLAHSYFAALLAIRRVTSSTGRNTPGVDGVLWRTSRQKRRAVNQLHRRGYRALPLRRVHIPKDNGKTRPLGIPTMRDRAMQALYALGLEPIAETQADPNSYGFRYGRGCADAIQQCYTCLSQKHGAQWVLEADIASCFDNISHQWLMEHVPIDKRVLRQWLKAGFLEHGKLHPTVAGTPQGGVISPLLMNMTLDGLETTVKRSVPQYIKGTDRRSSVHVIRYADDFIVTGKTEQMLRQSVAPAVEAFLRQRGLSLSERKTRITRVEQGFDFLGQQVRKYGDGRLLTWPSRKSLRRLVAKMKLILQDHRGERTWAMIERLNQLIGGWCNYHRHSCASRMFKKVDAWLFLALKRWTHYRHPNKGLRWLQGKYYRYHANRRWSFHASRRGTGRRVEYLDLVPASRTRFVRHVKVRADANPFDPRDAAYLIDRKKRGRSARQRA